jgi:adenosylhomocysteinase
VVVIEVDPIRALSAAMEGYRVMTAAESAPIGDVFLTATGDIHIFRPKHFAVMKDSVILANAGHFDVELDLEGLNEMAVARREIRDDLEEYELADGRRIIVVAEGRLVNLGAAEGHPADVMDMSFADQALAAEWLVQGGGDLPPDVYTLPRELDEDVARLKLAAMGAGLETLTEEQAKYLESWEEGT